MARKSAFPSIKQGVQSEKNTADITEIKGKVSTLESDRTSHDTRITTNETDIDNLETRASSLEGDVSNVFLNYADKSYVDQKVLDITSGGEINLDGYMEKSVFDADGDGKIDFSKIGALPDIITKVIISNDGKSLLIDGVPIDTGAYRLAETGIPEAELDEALKSKINSAYILPVEGITEEEIAEDLLFKLNNAYIKPTQGIPASDLDYAVQNNLNIASTSYQKPDDGIPERDLAKGIQDKINQIATNVQLSALSQDVRDKLNHALYDYTKNGQTYTVDKRIRKAELHTLVQDMIDRGNTAYQKPSDGIPIHELEQAIQDSINGAFVLPIGGIDETLLAFEVRQKLNNIGTGTGGAELSQEQIDKINHIYEERVIEGATVTVDFRIKEAELSPEIVSSLNKAKTSYQKPVGGIALIELEQSLQNSINEAFVLPVGGIGETLLSEDVVQKLNSSGSGGGGELSQEQIDRINHTFEIRDDGQGGNVTIDYRVKEAELLPSIVDSLYHRNGREISRTQVDSTINGLLDKASTSYQLPLGGIPLSQLEASIKTTLQDSFDHTNLTNIGKYSHGEIDEHIENMKIHSGDSLGKWILDDYEQMDYALKTDCELMLDERGNPVIKLAYNEVSEKYTTQGEFTTRVFDTAQEDEGGVKFGMFMSSSIYISGITKVAFKTRTGNTETPDITWSTWQDVIDNEIQSPNGRYIQVYCKMETADSSKTPVFRGISVYYGTNIREAFDKASGGFEDLDARLTYMTDLATHNNRDILNALAYTGDTAEPINLDKLHSHYNKDILRRLRFTGEKVEVQKINDDGQLIFLDGEGQETTTNTGNPVMVTDYPTLDLKDIHTHSNMEMLDALSQDALDSLAKLGNPADIISIPSENRDTIASALEYIATKTSGAVDKFNEEITVASDTWTIEHNKGTKFVNIQVWIGGQVFFPKDIEYVDNNTHIVRFNQPQKGFVVVI